MLILVIEAIFEDKAAKLSIFNKLNSIVKSRYVSLLSNTSSISITELSSATADQINLSVCTL
ncbi:MAG: 3-hydroxyacyl-CoA dehydrogenase NAD-binding domain-containing protein [Ignavibacteriales bacterium]|nr:3-hydroxyacyl-CoA dehydrogenase NAD-binding domain-containing protein [Ignavibacteriales bacterium]